MPKQEKLNQVKIYLELTNYLGDVIKSHEIATFTHINWAHDYIKNCLLTYDLDGHDRYKIQFGDGRIVYITKNDKETIKTYL